MSALSATAKHEYYIELASGLPSPILDDPAIRQRRLTTAAETFEALRPGDAFEGRLAAQIVLTGAHAVECLREADEHGDDFAKRSRCRAQAAGFMREERAARRMLAQEQKMRLAVEAVAAGAPAAAAAQPPAQAEPRDVAAEVQAAAAAAPAPEAAVTPIRPAAARTAASPAPDTAPPPSAEAIAKAEAYAQEDIVAAAQIRHDGGVTPQNKAYLRHLTLPSDPALIDALVRGTSIGLRVLDDVGAETLDQAA